jgi:hypothetical protein
VNKAKTVGTDDGKFYGIRINCPGCKSGGRGGALHVLPVRWLPPGREEAPAVKDWPHWDFNGDMERPTLSPSILSRREMDGKPYVCHSFVRDGNIEFLSDCTHEFAGQTIPLPDVESDFY